MAREPDQTAGVIRVLLANDDALTVARDTRGSDIAHDGLASSGVVVVQAAPAEQPACEAPTRNAEQSPGPAVGRSQEHAVNDADRVTVRDQPTAMSLGETLNAVKELLTRFVHLPGEAEAVAVTLWVALAHCWTLFDDLVYLVLTSAVKRSGKTITLDVIEQLVPTPWRVIRPTEAVTFRRIEQDHPTLLLDEHDTVFNERSQFEGLRAIFNAGNRRGTKVPRAVPNGHGYDVVDFDVFCPKALAGIGSLPDTITDRAIVIHMTRRAPGERIERLRVRELKASAEPIRAALAAHLRQQTLVGIVPAIPEVLNDRAADGWEALLTIAEVAGEDWPERARAAAIALSSDGVADDENLAITLLGDVRAVFREAGTAQLWTARLLEALLTIEGSPWADMQGRPLSPTRLAKVLRPFGIRPQQLKVNGVNRWGYLAGAFADAWTRYLPAAVTGDATGTTAATEDPEQVGSSRQVSATQVAEVAAVVARREGDDLKLAGR